MQTKLPNILAFVDIETTGGSVAKDKIIEIGIIRVENGKVVCKYQTLINPHTYLPPEIQLLTGITSKDLDCAPSFYEIKNDVKRILEGAVFVAHNVRFDYSFIKNAFSEYDVEFSPKQLCTVKLVRKLYPDIGHWNLDSIIKNFNFKCKNRHRAFDDANVLYQFYKHIIKNIDSEKLEIAIELVTKKPTIPINLSSDDLNNLPNSAGVYIFYGKNEMPLYVGKSVNLKNRVLSHFNSDYQNSIEMKISQQVYKIETIKCAGELGALITESSLIKSMQPLYNRLLRNSKKLVYLKTEKDKLGYINVKIGDCINLDNIEVSNICGIFKNKKQAKEALINISTENNLCEKLLGIENLGKNCFGYSLGKCKGACIGKESSQIYNLRFQIAFAKLKLKSWPYAGPIKIVEQNSIYKIQETYILDKWCLITKIVNNEFDEKIENFDNLTFDYDLYKILIKFLLSSKNNYHFEVMEDTEKVKKTTYENYINNSWIQ